MAVPHLPLVCGIANAADLASLLELFEDRRQCVGFQEQFLAERADGLVALLRQGHHRDLLGSICRSTTHLDIKPAIKFPVGA